MRRLAALTLAVPLTLALLACDDARSPSRMLSPHASGAPSAAQTPTVTDATALAIDANIRALHLPFGTIVDPVFASGDSTSADFTTLAGYGHAGDAAIWTGHYLAAEAFRYAVTRSPDALDNARRSLAGITDLVNVTSSHTPDVLARFAIPASSPYAAEIIASEARHGAYTSTYRGETWYWLDNISRDQYTGVFLGLATAYDLIDDDAVRDTARVYVSRMLNYLVTHGWSVQRPDGSYSTTFLQRPDQQLALLQIGRHVDPAAWTAAYVAFRGAYAATVGTPWQSECLDPHGSYYKFNLDYANAFSLVRLEEASSPFRAAYLAAYGILRGCTGSHQNAHFNMVDRALTGAQNSRDRHTAKYLALWLERPRRDYYRDLRGLYPACGEDRACDPIPVDERVNTDFLWQRSPFLLYGGGDGRVETAGIDYLLPYWMGRYYGVIGG